MWFMSSGLHIIPSLPPVAKQKTVAWLQFCLHFSLTFLNLQQNTVWRNMQRFFGLYFSPYTSPFPTVISQRFFIHCAVAFPNMLGKWACNLCSLLGSQKDATKCCSNQILSFPFVQLTSPVTSGRETETLEAGTTMTHSIKKANSSWESARNLNVEITRVLESLNRNEKTKKNK